MYFRHEALVVPIFGMAVPFHISNIKSVSKHEEGNYTYLRINLYCPGSTIIKQNGSTTVNQDSVFVKEVSFRGTHEKGNASAANLDHTTRMIKVWNLLTYSSKCLIEYISFSFWSLHH